MGIGVTALVAFVLIERRATGTPLIPLRLVTSLAITVGPLVTPWLMWFVRQRLLIACGALLAAAGFGWQSRASRSASSARY